MGNEIGKLNVDQIFSLIDRNGNRRIDKDDNLDLASMFGLKPGDDKIKPNKVKDFDEKASLFTQISIKNQSVNVSGDYNELIVIHGNNNDASIAEPAVYTPENNEYSDEAKFAMRLKGLEPAQISAAGFDEVEQKVDKDGKTTLILKSSKDGYNLEISKFQDNPIITRENGKLKLDGVQGQLNIEQKPGIKNHEIILSNIYADNIDEPLLKINNNSDVPLTRTYQANDKGELSYDAARALNPPNTGFPPGEALHGGFTQVSITEDPLAKTCFIDMESNKHGYKMHVNGKVNQGEMTLDYRDFQHRLIVKQLKNADIDITEDGADEHRLDICNVYRVYAENKTKKPTHVFQSILRGSKDKSRTDNSSFTFKTATNFDTFQRETRERLIIDISSDGVLAKGKTTRSCPCNGREHWAVTTGKVVGAFSTQIDLGAVYHKEPEIKLAPGEFIIKPNRSKYSGYEKTVRLIERNKKNIGYVTMNDYIRTKKGLKPNSFVGLDSKIGRSQRDWIGMGIDIRIEDQSVNVTGNGNKVIAVFGDNNIAHIDASPNGHMSKDAKYALKEMFHLKADMFDKAGFSQVDFVRNGNGEISEIVLTNNDGTKLTLPTDEAFLFSDQMEITKDRKGVYHVSNLVGKFEGSGMPIDCTNSNVDLTIIEHDSENGYIVFNTSDKNNKNHMVDAIHINYSVEDGGNARVYRGKIKKRSTPKPGKITEYTQIDISYPSNNKDSRIEIT